MSELAAFLMRAEAVLARLETLLPEAATVPDWSAAEAFRWQRPARGHAAGRLCPIRRPHRIQLDDLAGIDEQKARIEQNTRQFVRGGCANNVLLTGARGTGKSSLVKAMFERFAPEGLRMIEVDKADLVDLPQIVDLIEGRPERFIIFCDDLSFEAHEPGYKMLKSVLDGSLAAAPDNLLIYATSNRRHLMPEFMAENLATGHSGDEIHPEETVEEKVSLSDRFGLWLSFYPFDQETYLAICRLWLQRQGLSAADPCTDPDLRIEALQWALSRGARNGRVARQFASDLAGRLQS
jgi:predicted AAA+ superfamily ATPase